MLTLGIETSCDETAAAVVEDGRRVLSNVVASQTETHKLYGGVVPEIASRLHAGEIASVVATALREAGADMSNIDAVAVSSEPGLVGALLVGVSFAKGLSLSAGKPLVGVHHIKAHIAANFLSHTDLEPPFLCFIASGGHTLLLNVKSYVNLEILGGTLDDAAGEAFDKCARALGFPYPGGMHIEQAAKTGDPSRYILPKPKTNRPFDFSFSGIKTSVLNILNTNSQRGAEIEKNSLAACLQSTICEYIFEKAGAAMDCFKPSAFAAAGGVIANGAVRKTLEELCRKRGVRFFCPPKSLCTDNAAMVASQGYFEFAAGNLADMTLNASATAKLPEAVF